MKSKALVIPFLVLCLLAAFVATKAQTYVYGSREGNVSKVISKDSTDKVLIADETWITQLKTGAKIISYSEKAFTDISLKFGDRFNRISILYKSDRHGPYKEYSIYLSKELATEITNWAKTNL